MGCMAGPLLSEVNYARFKKIIWAVSTRMGDPSGSSIRGPISDPSSTKRNTNTIFLRLVLG